MEVDQPQPSNGVQLDDVFPETNGNEENVAAGAIPHENDDQGNEEQLNPRVKDWLQICFGRKISQRHQSTKKLFW